VEGLKIPEDAGQRLRDEFGEQWEVIIWRLYQLRERPSKGLARMTTDHVLLFNGIRTTFYCMKCIRCGTQMIKAKEEYIKGGACSAFVCPRCGRKRKSFAD
jgi:hypothetical protein